MARLKIGLAALATAADIFFCTLLVLPFYWLGLAPPPSGRQLISSLVGQCAAAGQWWAILAARVIDRVATALGDAPNHCERAFRKYQFLDD
ncbi:MAG: hypothetical protein ABT11_04050 [Novosphingobium sp. SCN 66-18]|nr:MAG: hypothetical protein ABT11_04050 [Novosphingobium sp. SCN 66-18]